MESGNCGVLIYPDITPAPGPRNATPNYDPHDAMRTYEHMFVYMYIIFNCIISLNNSAI